MQIDWFCSTSFLQCLPSKRFLAEFTSAAFEQNSKMRDRMSNNFRKPDSDELNGPFSSGFLKAPCRRQ